MTNVSRAAIVVGIGATDRGDDGAGLMTARKLRARLPPDIEVVECAGDLLDLLACFERAETVVVVDACLSGAPVGHVRRFDVNETRLPPSYSTISSHGFGLADAVELARALRQLPKNCTVHAIEGDDFEKGAIMSSAVARAVDEVAAVIEHELTRSLVAQ